MKREKFLMALAFVGILLAGCAPQQALIDRTAMEKILWPGPPEKPRVSFLWSVSTVSVSADAGLARLFAGDEDVTDPRTSPRLLRPFSIFVDEQGLLYITDPGAYRITIIDQKSGDSRSITNAGGEDFVSPVGLVVFRGLLYVSDSFLKQVFILDREGKLTGKLEGGFERPTSLALDRNRGLLYVADTLAHIIYRYSPDGKLLGSIGKPGSGEGEFNYPTHLWVDDKGRLYVTDAMNFRVQIFSPDGTFDRMFGMLGDAYGDLEKPKGIATDSDGNIYVVDAIKDMVKIFSREAGLLLFFGQQGRNFGEFWLPSGIFIDNNDHIYVADTYNGRVQVFQYLRSK